MFDPNNCTFDEWFQEVHASYDWETSRTQRYGQYLYNSLPNRWVGNIPAAYDPFYNDDNVDIFLVYIKNRW